jgi:hypothetical protein
MSIRAIVQRVSSSALVVAVIVAMTIGALVVQTASASVPVINPLSAQNLSQPDYLYPYSIVVSCWSPGNCTELARAYSQSLADEQYFTLNQVNGTWGLPVVFGSSSYSLNSISCWSSGNCVVAGAGPTSQAGVFTELDGVMGSWQSIPLADPGSSFFNSVSCTSAGTCTAVGAGQVTAGSLNVGVIASNLGASWPANLVQLQDASTVQTVLNAVSCASNGVCTAVGSDANGPLFATGSGQTFGSAQTLPAPDNISDYLNSISCTSDGGCTATGYFLSFGCPFAGVAGAHQAQAPSYACAQPIHADGVDYRVGFAVQFVNGAWGTPTILTAPSGSVGSDPVSVSCTSSGTCVLVATSYDGSFDQIAYALDNNGTWGAEVLVASPTDINGAFAKEISCSAPAACTIIGWNSANLLATTISPQLVLASSLPSATVGSAYGASVLTSGGMSPLHFVVTSGSLPPGLVLDSFTGTLSGTPTTPGSWSFSVTATDSSSPGQSATASFSLTVNPAAELAATGFPGASLFLFGAAVLATGGVTLAMGRRRNAQKR